MKKLAFIFCAALMLSVGSTASAQFMGGNGSGRSVVSSADAFNTLWLGYAPTSMKVDSHSTSGYNTFSLGFTRAMPISGAPILVEAGLFADWMTKTEKEGKAKITTNMVDAKVPVNVMYPLAVGDAFTLYPYAGLNARLYVIGKQSYSYDGEKETVDLFDDDSDAKRFSLGYQFGVRARISSFLVGIGYEDMITSLSDDGTAKINYITLSVGIPF